MNDQTSESENPPAFPNEGFDDPQTDGMTLRDYFAAQAMQGDVAAQAEGWHVFAPETTAETLLSSARLYYRMADAMLRARKEQP